MKVVNKEVPKEVDGLLEKYKGIFLGDTPDELPPLRDISHQIEFIPPASLAKKVIYKLTSDQNVEVSRYINYLLENGLIQKSLNPCAVPSVLAPKKDGKWKLCNESREINKITIRYSCPIRRIEDLLHQLGGACYFYSIDLKLGYH